MCIVQLEKYILWSCGAGCDGHSKMRPFSPDGRARPCRGASQQRRSAGAAALCCRGWSLRMLFLDRWPPPGPPEAPLSFFIQKQHRASDGADCTPDSSDCFSTLPCLFSFSGLLYFRDLQSLFWPGWNLLFYFWLRGFHVDGSVKQRTWGGRGSGVPVGCLAVLHGAVASPTRQGRAGPQGGFAAKDSV